MGKKKKALHHAARLFDEYAGRHLRKDPPQLEKAQRNLDAAEMMHAALGLPYLPPHVEPAGCEEFEVMHTSDLRVQFNLNDGAKGITNLSQIKAAVNAQPMLFGIVSGMTELKVANMVDLLEELGHQFVSTASRADSLASARRNLNAADRCYQAIGLIPPKGGLYQGTWDRISDVKAQKPAPEPDSVPLAAQGALKLLRSAHAAPEPLKGVQVHVDDQPVMDTLVELGYLTRSSLTDDLVVTTLGKEKLGIRPDGVPDAKVVIKEAIGDIEERELAGQYIDAKIAGVEKWLANNPSSASKYEYDIMARVLTEIAHEFRIGMHLPSVHIEGRVIPYNDDNDTGIKHADALRTFFMDTHARNLKAGWWTDLKTGEPLKRSVGELFILMVTELVEAYDAWYDGGSDDKLPQYPGLGVEIGDLLIRIGDFGGALLAGSIVDFSGTINPGDEAFREIAKIARGYEEIRKTPEAVGATEMGDYIPSQDIGEMADAKLTFNAKRADHKIENRLKDDGKKT